MNIKKLQYIILGSVFEIIAYQEKSRLTIELHPIC